MKLEAQTEPQKLRLAEQVEAELAGHLSTIVLMTSPFLLVVE